MDRKRGRERGGGNDGDEDWDEPKDEEMEIVVVARGGGKEEEMHERITRWMSPFPLPITSLFLPLHMLLFEHLGEEKK